MPVWVDFHGFCSGGPEPEGGLLLRPAGAEIRPGVGVLSLKFFSLPLARRQCLGIAGKVLIAEKIAVLVKITGKQADPSLEIFIDGDAHGGNVPPVTVQIPEGTAVASTLHKAAGPPIWVTPSTCPAAAM